MSLNYSEVSLTQGLPVYYYSSKRGTHNWAVECNMGAFQSFSLLYAGREGYVEAS